MAKAKGLSAERGGGLHGRESEVATELGKLAVYAADARLGKRFEKDGAMKIIFRTFAAWRWYRKYLRLGVNHEIIPQIRVFQASKTPGWRLAFWDHMMEGYCPECGRKFSGHWWCECGYKQQSYEALLEVSVRTIGELLGKLNNKSRMEVWNKLASGYCKHCGTSMRPASPDCDASCYQCDCNQSPDTMQPIKTIDPTTMAQGLQDKHRKEFPK
jgi:hypothetical protein